MPASDTTDMGVLLPVKSFRHAKLRLAPVLPPTERARLARAMAAHVLGCASGLPTAVVCDDDEVARWARGEGAAVVWTPGRGLDGAVAEGVAWLGTSGLRRVIVAHADLPLAHDLRGIGGFAGVTLVPDRRGNGTNVACVPAAAGFRFSYGAGSFGRHAAEARRLGLPLRTVHDPLLAHDIDVPADLLA